LHAELSPTAHGRVHVLQGEYDQSEMKGIIGQLEFFLGSRMHACIAAISQLIPCVGLAYSRKFAGVFEAAGVGSMVLDLQQHELEFVLSACLERYRDRELARRSLEQRIPEIRRQLEDCFREEWSASSSNERLSRKRAVVSEPLPSATA
jgi:polysaccharide pyruvyl transferase WcaK-like protein